MPDKDASEAAVRTLLRWIGEDPQRDGLLKTPHRVAKAWLEMTQGYNANVADMLALGVPREVLVSAGVLAGAGE